MRSEPGAKGAGLSVVDEARQFLVDHHEDVLQQVVGVGRLEAMPSQPAAQPRLVDGQPELPGLGIRPVPQPVEQTGRRREHEETSREQGCRSRWLDRSLTEGGQPAFAVGWTGWVR